VWGPCLLDRKLLRSEKGSCFTRRQLLLCAIIQPRHTYTHLRERFNRTAFGGTALRVSAAKLAMSAPSAVQTLIRRERTDAGTRLNSCRTAAKKRGRSSRLSDAMFLASLQTSSKISSAASSIERLSVGATARASANTLLTDSFSAKASGGWGVRRARGRDLFVDMARGADEDWHSTMPRACQTPYVALRFPTAYHRLLRPLCIASLS